VEQLLQASFGGLVSLDFQLPPALLGVGDELVLAVESGSDSGVYSLVVRNLGHDQGESSGDGVLEERSEEGVDGRRPARLCRSARRRAPFSRRADFPRRQLRRGRVSCDRNRHPSSCSADCAQAGLRHLSTTVQPHSSKWPRSF
jgi:hypothetical protein